MIVNKTTTYTSALQPNFKASLLAQMTQNYHSAQIQQQDAPVVQTLIFNSADVPLSTPAAQKYNRMYGP